jgi:hypothetical protein
MSRSTTTRPTRRSSAASAIVAACLLAGCAGYGPGDLKPGQPEADVRARMGEPTLQSRRPDGSARLDYGRGPYGKHGWRIDIDAAGRVQRIEQLLTERNFEALPLQVDATAVLERLGPPSERRVGWRGVGEVWSYRFEDWFWPCRWFQVWLVEGRVREAGYGTDPVCEESRLLD